MPKACMGILALFDEDTNRNFAQLNSYLKNAKIRRIDIPPHITLGIYDLELKEELFKWLKECTIKQQRVPVNFNHIGLFGESVLFVAPQVNKQLLSLHEKLHSKYDDKHADIGFLYSLKSGEFVPHASLVVSKKDEVLRAVPVICEQFKPFRGEIVSLCLCTFYPFKVLQNFNL